MTACHSAENVVKDAVTASHSADNLENDAVTASHSAGNVKNAAPGNSGARSLDNSLNFTKQQAMELPDTELRRQASGIRLISLFGGKHRPKDGMDTYIQMWGATVDVYDIEISPEHDLLDQGLWGNVENNLEEGKYDGGMNAPPCGTFCANRSNDGGPRALRGPEPPDLYGIKGLVPKEKESVRQGTCLALRTRDCCTILHTHNANLSCFNSRAGGQTHLQC